MPKKVLLEDIKVINWHYIVNAHISELTGCLNSDTTHTYAQIMSKKEKRVKETRKA